MPYQMVDRGPGDMATYYTDPTYAAEIPNWKAESELDEIYEYAWHWQSMDLNGHSEIIPKK